MTDQMCSASVITPLRNIIDDQIKEAEGLGLTATSLAAASVTASFLIGRRCTGRGISQRAERKF